MQKFLPKIKNGKPSAFTIMEILVATTLFAFTSVALTTLFNYTLKINRRAEALRQATQGTLDFVGLLAKEVRNGQIDYGLTDPGGTSEAPNSVCPQPSGSGASSYTVPDNRLGIVDTNGNRWCFYLSSDSQGDYVGQQIYAGKTVALVKIDNGTAQSMQILNPPNETISYLAFFIQPICDPYVANCTDYGSAAPKIQPVVTMLATFTIKLPTGETVSIPYQTTISTDRYDVPDSP
jgi:type II secretory pathway pseudopilin PulG